jgi:hypothetical protein
MSMALMMASLYYLIRYFESPSSRNLALLFILNIFALVANLSLYVLTLAMALTALYRSVLFVSQEKRPQTWTKSLLFVFLFIIPSLFFAIVLFEMKEKDLLYYGSDAGIWKLTARSVIQLLAASKSILFEWFWGIIITFVMGGGIWLLVKNRWKISSKQLFFILFIITVFAIIAMNIILGINYPEDRVGLYLFPLLVGSYFFIADNVTERLRSLFLLPFIWLPFHFIYHSNMEYAECYKTDIIPLEFYTLVKDSHDAGELPATIGGYRTRHFCWSFHDYRHNGSQNQIYYATYPGSETDFLICEAAHVDSMAQYYMPLLVEEVNNRVLMERKGAVTKEKIDSMPAIVTDGWIEDEYWLIYEAFVDSLAGHTLQADFDFGVASPEIPFESRIVLSIHDEDYNELRYEFLELDWLRKEWNRETGYLNHSLIVDRIPENAYRLRLYLWSIENKPYEILEGTCKLNVINP